MNADVLKEKTKPDTIESAMTEESKTGTTPSTAVKDHNMLPTDQILNTHS